MPTAPKTSKLRSWREGQGLSLDEVAGLTGFSQGFLSRLERGERRATRETKLAISRALDASISTLFDPEPARTAALRSRAQHATTTQNGGAVSPGAASPPSSNKAKGGRS